MVTTNLNNAVKTVAASDVAIGILCVAPVRGKRQLVAITGHTEGYGDFYTPVRWASVQLNGRVRLPWFRSMAFFYNDSVFEQVVIDARFARGTTIRGGSLKSLSCHGRFVTPAFGDDLACRRWSFPPATAKSDGQPHRR